MDPPQSVEEDLVALRLMMRAICSHGDLYILYKKIIVIFIIVSVIAN